MGVAEHPVETRPDADAPVSLYVPWAPQPPRVVVKADLLPAASVLSFIALLGLAVGWLWSRLAPTQLAQVIEDGRLVPLRTESYHRFDDLALFTLFGIAAGVLTGVALWMLRERRGPVVLVAALIGSGLAAWLAMRVGLSWAEGRYVVSAAPAVGDVLALAPRLESNWGILGWPFGTVVAYGFLAAWNGRDDLGRRLG